MYGTIYPPLYSGFDKGQRDKYLQSIGITSQGFIDPLVLAKYYILICNDFLQMSLGLDEFSAISEYLWHNKLDHELKLSEFGQFLMQNGELSWGVRHPQEGDVGNIVRLITQFVAHDGELVS